MLIFDFDGTLADSLHTLLECFNNNADYYGYKKIDNPEQLRSKDMRDILNELAIPFFKLPFIANTIRQDMRKKIKGLHPFPDIIATIMHLHQQRIPMGILTSNAKENVEKFLTIHGLNVFSFIYDKSSLFGKGKILKNLISSYQLDPAATIYIGDEVRDIEAAHANKIRCAAVTWGFHTVEKLQEKQPTYLIRHPHELFMLVQKQNIL